MKKHSIPTSPSDRSDMIKQIQSRRSWKVGRISSRKSIHLVEIAPGFVVQVEYSRRYKKIMAVYAAMTLEDVWAA